MKLFKRDSAAQLQKDRAALAAAKTRLAELERERADTLMAEAGWEITWKADRAAAEQQAAVSILGERIKVLQHEVRKAEQAKLMAARDKAVDTVIAPQFQKIQALAERLQFAVEELGRAYAGLVEAQREVSRAWPGEVPKPSYWEGGWSLLDIAGRLRTACRYAESGSFHRFSEFFGMDRTETITAMVERQCAAAIVELKQVEITPPLLPVEHARDDDGPSAPVAPRPAQGLSEGLATA
jgi:hypothetical protein